MSDWVEEAAKAMYEAGFQPRAENRHRRDGAVIRRHAPGWCDLPTCDGLWVWRERHNPVKHGTMFITDGANGLDHLRGLQWFGPIVASPIDDTAKIGNDAAVGTGPVP